MRERERGLYAVVTVGPTYGRVSVSAVTARLVSVIFIYCVETSRPKHIFELFSPQRSRTILVFRGPNLWNYSDGDQPNPGPSNAVGYVKNRDFRPIGRVSKQMIIYPRSTFTHDFPYFR